MPKVSVIVPVYNVEKYLHRCVDSILAQTFTDFELILVDDGSPDNCGAICDEYAQKDHRVTVIHQKNGGVSAARNAGLDVACGEYVAFVDSDDYVDPEYLTALLRAKADLVICGMVSQKDSGEITGKRCYEAEVYAQKSDIDFAKLYRNIMLYSPYSKLFLGGILRDKQLRFPKGITWGEDGMFIADYLQYVNSACVIGSSGYHYVQHDAKESLSTKIRPDIIWMVETAREYCIEKMKTISPEYYDAVKQACEEDIRGVCAYFVRRVFYSTTLELPTKTELLNHFMESQYVKNTFVYAHQYYDQCLQKALCEKDARRMIYKYDREIRKKKAFLWIYENIYERQPEAVKQIYRRLKRVIYCDS